MPPSPQPKLQRERAWLHAGGRAGTWGSLGLWQADTADYASACEALAQRVAQAACVRQGASVLCVACGAGDELHLLMRTRQTAALIGVERDPALVALARANNSSPHVQVLQGDGAALQRLGLAPGSFDQVLCVDAAYHLRPREAFLHQAFTLLCPGGRLAYTDLCLEPTRGLWRAPLLRTAARIAGLSARDLLPADAQAERLRHLGFAGVQQQRLDDAVLGGFARFVRKQVTQFGSQHAGRAVWTARLIGPCRAAGLGYVLLSAAKPSSADATV